MNTARKVVNHPFTAYGKQTSIDACSACSTRISLVHPSKELAATPWKCRGCGAIYLAAPQRRGGSLFKGGVQTAYYWDVVQDVAHRSGAKSASLSTEDLRRLRECSASQDDDPSAQRKGQRHQVVTPIAAIPLTDDFRIAGELSTASTIDVSVGGMALLHPTPVTMPYLAIDFARSGIPLSPLILRLVRCSRIGSAYGVAGNFVSRIEY